MGLTVEGGFGDRVALQKVSLLGPAGSCTGPGAACLWDSLTDEDTGCRAPTPACTSPVSASTGHGKPARSQV